MKRIISLALSLSVLAIGVLALLGDFDPQTKFKIQSVFIMMMGAGLGLVYLDGLNVNAKHFNVKLACVTIAAVSMEIIGLIGMLS